MLTASYVHWKTNMCILSIAQGYAAAMVCNLPLKQHGLCTGIKIFDITNRNL